MLKDTGGEKTIPKGWVGFKTNKTFKIVQEIRVDWFCFGSWHAVLLSVALLVVGRAHSELAGWTVEQLMYYLVAVPSVLCRVALHDGNEQGGKRSKHNLL